MSAPADVLAVLDSLNLARPEQRPALREARAAMAELMAAVRLTLATGRISENLRPALEACGGKS